jgi:hypothetical protein
VGKSIHDLSVARPRPLGGSPPLPVGLLIKEVAARRGRGREVREHFGASLNARAGLPN